MRITNMFGAIVALALLTVGLPVIAVAQTYPINNPTYIPQVVLGSSTLSATGSVTFQVNGVSTLYFRLLGTYTGLTAVVEGTEARAGTPTWSARSVDVIGTPGRISTLSANGLYRLNSSGFAQVRIRVTAISTGSVAVTASGGVGPYDVVTLGLQRQTYSASTTALTTAASLTDFLTLTGSATTTVRIIRAACSGTSTAIGAGTITAVKRSTADTGGTSAALTAVPQDSVNSAATATALSYTANPTLGTAVGTLRAATIVLTPTSATTIGVQPLVWDFGGNAPTEQEIVLRGTAQVFALNGNATTLPGGASLNCSVTWTEELN